MRCDSSSTLPQKTHFVRVGYPAACRHQMRAECRGGAAALLLHPPPHLTSCRRLAFNPIQNVHKQPRYISHSTSSYSRWVADSNPRHRSSSTLPRTIPFPLPTWLKQMVCHTSSTRIPQTHASYGLPGISESMLTALQVSTGRSAMSPSR